MTTTTTDYPASPFKRIGAPRFTEQELAVIRKAAKIEDRDVANLVRVATLKYAVRVVAREGNPE